MRQEQTLRIRKDTVEQYKLTDEYLFKKTVKNLIESMTIEELNRAFKLKKLDSLLEPEPNGNLIKWIEYSVVINLP